MKKIIALCATLLLSFAVNAAQFDEGEHYTILENTKVPENPTVTEYFSFYCGHCYKFENVVTQLKKNIPENVSFQKVHVSFMGNAMAVPMAKAYATMVVLKNEDVMVPAMFHKVQIERKAPGDMGRLRQVFLDNGVSAKDFESAFNSFAVDSMQKRFDVQFNEVGLRGVPGVVVNNKYVVNAGSISSIEEYFDLVNFLLKM